MNRIEQGDAMVADVHGDLRYGYADSFTRKNGERVIFIVDYYGNDLGWAYDRQSERLSQGRIIGKVTP